MVDARSVELFVDFVRKNAWLPGNDPAMLRAFNAYVKLEEPLRVREPADLSEEEVVDYVEVTHDRSPLPVVVPERPPEARRSGAKNVSDPHLQNAFIDESRAAMGQPSLKEAESFLGERVVLTFNVDWHPATGELTEIRDDSAVTAYLILDGYRERLYPLNAIQSIKLAET